MSSISLVLSSFRRSESGVAAVEFSLIAPTLVLLLFGCITFFIVFADSNRAETATFTVADIVSRQTTVSSDSLGTVYAMFEKMLPTTRKASSFRISSLKMKDSKFTVDWSYPVAPMVALVDSTIPIAKLPLVANGDSLIFVETQVGYAPISVLGGLNAGVYSNIAANRPRFTSSIVKSN